MSNPTKASREGVSHPFSEIPQSRFDLPKSVSGKASPEEVIRTMMGGRGTDVQIAKSQVITASRTVDPYYVKGGKLARAEDGVLEARRRSHVANELLVTVYELIPESEKEEISDRMRNSAVMMGGTQGAFGRLKKHWPLRRAKSSFRAPTSSELEKALDHCGQRVNVPGQAIPQKLPVQNVLVNKNSSNGFPVLGKMSDPEASMIVMSLASSLHSGITSAYATGRRQGVHDFWEGIHADAQNAELVLFRGKMKTDVYKVNKILERGMRFYNVCPRQVMLLMQTVAQPYENNCRHFLQAKDGEDIRTAQGFSYAHGGADKLVRHLHSKAKPPFELEPRERRNPFFTMTWLHVGDDTWLVIAFNSFTVNFSLDCTAFDLTQRKELIQPVVEMVEREMSHISGAEAATWRYFMLHRRTVVGSTVVMDLFDAGPSGMALQSKVNDLICDILCQRLESSLATNLKDLGYDPTTYSRHDFKEFLSWNVEVAGKSLDLEVRLEDYSEASDGSYVGYGPPGSTSTHSFLFLGYRIYYDYSEDKYKAYADMARTMASLAYPNKRWIGREQFEASEAVRLGSIFLSMGEPPKEWLPFFLAYRDVCTRLLAKAGDAAVTNQLDASRFEWVYSGSNVARTYYGLLEAIERDFGAIWGDVEFEHMTTLGIKLPRPGKLKSKGETTHPATIDNAGRPPPTAQWGPPKPKRLTPAEKKAILHEVNHGSKTLVFEWEEDNGHDEFDRYEHDEYDEVDYGNEFDQLYAMD